MFQNAYQSGPSVEIFDPKVTKEKEKSYLNLYKIHNIAAIKRIYDKSMKGFLYEFDSGVNSKIQFPKDDKKDLALVQQYLILQLFVPIMQPFSIELILTDISKTKRRINLTSAVSKIDINYFHVKIPIEILKRGVWLNLSIDILSFMEVFKGQTFRSLDGLIITSVCKLRKIFTMKYPPYTFSDGEYSLELSNAQEIPKSLNFPTGVQYQNQLITYEMIKNYGFDPPLTFKEPLKTSKNTENDSKTPMKNQDQQYPEDFILKKQIIPVLNNKPKPVIKPSVSQPEEEKTSFLPVGKASKYKINNPWISKKNEKLVQKQNIPQKEDEYLEKSSKFNTLTDPRILEGLLKTDPKKFNDLNEWNHEETLEIEENIKDIDSLRNSMRNNIQKSQKSNEKTSKSTNTPSKSPLKRDIGTNFQNFKGEIKQEIIEITDNITENSVVHSTTSSPHKNLEILAKRAEESSKNNTVDSKKGERRSFYETELEKIMKEEIRPVSPPFNNWNQSELKEQDKKEEKLLEVVYDPVLNCYYDPKTNSYYDLIN